MLEANTLHLILWSRHKRGSRLHRLEEREAIHRPTIISMGTQAVFVRAYYKTKRTADGPPTTYSPRWDKKRPIEKEMVRHRGWMDRGKLCLYPSPPAWPPHAQIASTACYTDAPLQLGMVAGLNWTELNNFNIAPMRVLTAIFSQAFYSNFLPMDTNRFTQFTDMLAKIAMKTHEWLQLMKLKSVN